MTKMFNIMFLCTGNTCRSQMAEGFANALGKDILKPFSAGVSPVGFVHPMAIAVMKEAGIDISEQKSKGIDKNLIMKMDMVITLCGNAEQTCPLTPPEIKRRHWPIDDPVSAKGTGDEVINKFRKVRDEIKCMVENLIKELGNALN